MLLALAAVAAVAGDEALSPDPLRYVSPSRSFKTTHTALDLDIDLKHQRIAGSATHTIHLLQNNISEIHLNCVALNVESVEVNGAQVDFDYPVAGSQSTSWLGRLDESRAAEELVIHLAQPAKRGTELQLAVKYNGEPRKGLYWVAPEKGLPDKRYEVWSQGEGEDNRYWIPCHDYPDDKASFEGRFRVDKGYYVLSNGALISREIQGDREEFYWKLESPQVSYLIMIAAARYEVHEDEANGVPLIFVVPPGTGKEKTLRGYGLTGDMLEFFERTIGIKYPFEKYAQVSVQNFIYGGMENTTATVMNMRTLYDERTELTRDVEGLVAHELAHQWWGDMLTCREWTHMWLNEGFATYYQALYREYHQGDDAFRYQVLERHRQIVTRDDNKPRPVVTDFYNRIDARNNASIYIKGSSVLHMLRFLLGDETYHAVVHYYGEKHKYGLVETSDFARAVKDVSGQNLDWFFEQWIYLAGHPKFVVSSDYDSNDGILQVTVKQTQEAKGIVPVFRTPVDIEITTDEGARTHRVLIDSAEQDFYFKTKKPSMVIFDKGDWIIKTLQFPKTTEELLFQLEHGDYIARVRAAEWLAKKASVASVVPALQDVVLADGHYGLRREAALSLGKIGNDEARAALFQGLEVGDARVRLACAEALGQFRRDEKVAKRLRELVQNDPAYGVRARAVASVVELRSKIAADVCYEAMKQESDRSDVRNAGIDGLVKLKKTDALNRIGRFAMPGNSRDHRHTAITAYARLAKELDDEKARESAVEFLAEMLDDWYLRTRQTAASALGILGESEAIAHLRRVESGDPLDEVRARARSAIRQIEKGTQSDASTSEMDARIRDLEDEIDKLGEELDKVRKRIPDSHGD